MTAATAYASLLAALKSVHGRTASLVGDGWRKDGLTVCFRGDWAGAVAGSIGIDRVEPTALISTSDVADYDFANGCTLEIGDDTFRITAQAKDDMGGTLLTLAKL